MSIKPEAELEDDENEVVMPDEVRKVGASSYSGVGIVNGGFAASGNNFGIQSAELEWTVYPCVQLTTLHFNLYANFNSIKLI